MKTLGVSFFEAPKKPQPTFWRAMLSFWRPNAFQSDPRPPPPPKKGRRDAGNKRYELNRQRSAARFFATSSRDHFFGSNGARGWPWRLGDDFVMNFGGFWPPFGASWGPLWRACGRQKLQMGGIETFFQTFWEPRNKYRKTPKTN